MSDSGGSEGSGTDPKRRSLRRNKASDPGEQQPPARSVLPWRAALNGRQSGAAGSRRRPAATRPRTRLYDGALLLLAIVVVALVLLVLT